MNRQTRQQIAKDFMTMMQERIIFDLATAPETWDSLEVRAYCSRAFLAEGPYTTFSWSTSRRVAFYNACDILPMRY